MRLARELASRIVALRYEDLPPQAVYGSRIGVLDTIGVMLAGSTLGANVDRPLGRTAQNPIPFENLQEKFQDCAQRVVSAEAAAAAARLIASMETLAAVGELTALLEPAARAKISSIVHA